VIWIKDSDGDLWNPNSIQHMYIDSHLNKDQQIEYTIKIVTNRKDTFEFRGPYKRRDDATEDLDMIYLEMTVQYEQ
jgi:hypothetical protein